MMLLQQMVLPWSRLELKGGKGWVQTIVSSVQRIWSFLIFSSSYHLSVIKDDDIAPFTDLKKFFICQFVVVLFGQCGDSITAPNARDEGERK